MIPMKPRLKRKCNYVFILLLYVLRIHLFFVFSRESQNNDSEINTYEPTAVTHSSSAMPPLQQPQQYQHQYQHRQRHNNTNNQYNQRHEQQQLQMQHHHKQQQEHHPTISIRRLDTLRPDFTNTTSSTPSTTINASSRKRSHHAMAAAASSSSTTAYNQQQQQRSSLRQSSHDDNESAISSVVTHNKRHRYLNGRELKYTAFGNFISSSLMDLPASIALELVEKFTSDVVKALMEKAEQEQHCKDVENFH